MEFKLSVKSIKFLTHKLSKILSLLIINEMSKVKATQLTSQLKAPHNFPGQNNYFTIINETKFKFTLLPTLHEIKKNH